MLTHCYGHASIGQDAILTAPFVHGDRYSLIAAMSNTGYLMSLVVPGSLDSYEFFDCASVMIALFFVALFIHRLFSQDKGAPMMWWHLLLCLASCSWRVFLTLFRPLFVPASPQSTSPNTPHKAALNQSLLLDGTLLSPSSSPWQSKSFMKVVALAHTSSFSGSISLCLPLLTFPFHADQSRCVAQLSNQHCMWVNSVPTLSLRAPATQIAPQTPLSPWQPMHLVSSPSPLPASLSPVPSSGTTSTSAVPLNRSSCSLHGTPISHLHPYLLFHLHLSHILQLQMMTQHQLKAAQCTRLADHLHPLWHTRRTWGKTLAASSCNAINTLKL